MADDLDATSSLYLNDEATAANDHWPVYDVCRIGTEDVVGQVRLCPDDRWRIVGDDDQSWEMIVAAVRMVMANA